jgi:glycosyltransferase involved in cell wall biosynthesis
LVPGDSGPTVSVVVPVGNAEAALAETLRTIADQTLSDFECICVPNGVRDGSLGILEEFAAADGRFRIVPADRPGAGNARNVGLAQAGGEYLAFWDADDLFDPTMLADLHARIKSTGADVCVCDARNYHHQQQRYGRTQHFLHHEYLPQRPVFCWQDIPERVFNFTTGTAWNKLFRREFILAHKLQFQDLPRMNDFYFSFAAIVLAERISVVDKVLVSYRRGAGGSLLDTQQQSPLVFAEVLAALQELLHDEGIQEACERSFANCAVRLTANALQQAGSQAGLVRDALQGGLLERFGILGHDESYFYERAEYRRLQELLADDVEVPNSMPLPVTPPLDPKVPVPLSVVIAGTGDQAKAAETVRCVQASSLPGLELIWAPLAEGPQFPGELNDRVRVLPLAASRWEAYNQGLAAAGGEYVLFADCDVVYPRYGLEHGYRAAAGNAVDQLFVPGEIFFDRAEEITYSRPLRNFFARLHDTDPMPGRELAKEILAPDRFRVHSGMQFFRRAFLVEHRLAFGSGHVDPESRFIADSLIRADRAMVWGEPLVSRRWQPEISFPSASSIAAQLTSATLATLPIGTPRVSVVMPVFNSERFLADAIDSVLAQSMSDWELMCVDDGSTDSSPQILRRYAEQDPRIKVARQENAGSSRARNGCLDTAGGEYICFLDDDDALEPHALEILCERADEDRLDLLCYGSQSFFDTEELKTRFADFQKRYGRSLGDSDPMPGRQLWEIQEQAGDFRMVVWLQLLRRSFVEQRKLRFYDGILHQDNLFSMQAMFFAERAGVIAQTLHHRRVREGSVMTGKKTFRHVQGYLTTFREVLAMAEAHPDEAGGEFRDTLLLRTWRLLTFGAAEEWEQVPAEEREAGLRKLPVADRLLLEWTIGQAGELRANRGKRRELEAALRAETAKNKALRASRTYRVGQSLAGVPRKLSRTLRRAPRESTR